MNHSSLYRGNGNSHHSNDLFGQSLAKFTKLDCFRIPGFNSFMASERIRFRSFLCTALFGIQALVFDLKLRRRLFGFARFIQRHIP